MKNCLRNRIGFCQGKRNMLGGTAAAVALGIWVLSALNLQAAGNGSIDIQKESLTMAAGETTAVSVSYRDVELGFADLHTLSANPDMVVPTLTDAGNGQAVLNIAASGTGSTVIAVYRLSSPGVVDYIPVYCTPGQEGTVWMETVSRTALVGTFDKRLVYYNSELNGRNKARLSVSGMNIEKESGLDCLTVRGVLTNEPENSTGLCTFYACFYDAGNLLIKRQAFYAPVPAAGSDLTLTWYVPEGCTQIVLE